MSGRPLVHIGYHKTATTWFQKLFYPRVRNAKYIPQLDVVRVFKAYDMLAPDAVGMRQALGGSDQQPAIICDETLCGSFREPYLRSVLGWTIAQVLATALPDADIVLFVRAQPDMMAATYAEYVRGGGVRSAVDFFELGTLASPQTLRTATMATPSIAHFEYDRLIARYDALFGAERVHVFLYEDFRRDPTHFLRRYAALLGLEVDLDSIDLSRENTSYSRKVLALARMINRFGQGEGGHLVSLNVPGIFKVSRSLLHRLNRLPGSGRAPTPAELFGTDILASLHQRFAPSNHRLGALRNLALSENGYPL